MSYQSFKSILYNVGPLMSNLILVYYLEYSIMTGWVQVIAIKILQSDSQAIQQSFLHRNAFIAFNFCYQIGVFISRSSSACLLIERVWILSLQQLVLFCFFALNTIWLFCANLYILFGLTILVGLMGGSSYVNVIN